MCVKKIAVSWSTDTPIWDDLAGPAKHERLAAMAAKLPAGRIGRPEDIARAFRALLGNEFITGTTLHVEGGLDFFGGPRETLYGRWRDNDRFIFSVKYYF